jgi:NAD(P)H-dependent flavin oxidoreductase YrpB (nitropropane dioxygenase family)
VVERRRGSGPHELIDSCPVAASMSRRRCTEEPVTLGYPRIQGKLTTPIKTATGTHRDRRINEPCGTPTPVRGRAAGAGCHRCRGGAGRRSETVRWKGWDAVDSPVRPPGYRCADRPGPIWAMGTANTRGDGVEYRRAGQPGYRPAFPRRTPAQWTRLRQLTDRPFAINHTGRPFSAEAFTATLDSTPKVISFHMGVPTQLIDRAHDRGILWMQTVGDTATAEAALTTGADVLIAQGGEAGGNAGAIATLVLVPAVVDIAGQVPVIAAGGIADGRGIAAALTLGAQGVSLGTRFLATQEMTIDQAWKDRIVAADALDAVKMPHAEQVLPPFTLPQIGVPFAPRSLRTPLIEQLETDPNSVHAKQAGPQLVQAIRTGRGHELLAFTGQSAGLVHDIVPAAELLKRLITETADALRRANAAVI